MLAAVSSAAILGVDAFDVTVEVDCTRGLPHWTVVGMPAGSVKESRERVSAAIANAGITLPPRRVTINLAPADVHKTGTAFDLPIAVASLVAFGVIDESSVRNAVFLGELGLDGAVRPVRGVLSVARRLKEQNGHRTLVLPRENIAEAGLVRGLALSAPASIAQLVEWLRQGALPTASVVATETPCAESADFADVIGQASAKRALEIAAAGGHNVLMIGPPGSGKTMLARRLPSILPSMTETECLEVTAIHSVAGLLRHGAGAVGRPFRAPHHSVSTAGLIGGSSVPRPGEVSLAHHGVLFLDELLEFPRHALEALRQPLEDGRVVISRAHSSLTFPAKFMLAAAMNPCPCAYAGHPARPCVCTQQQIQAYRGRLSGPLLDRIDLHVTLTPLPMRMLGSPERGEGSAAIRTRVEDARRRQRERFVAMPGVACNAQARGRGLLASASADARALLEHAVEALSLSARAYHRVTKVARTIADLAGDDAIAAEAMAEALRYRPG